MYLTYVDDAGDSGIRNSPTRHLVLAATLVHERDWLPALDALVALRRRLYQRYGIPSRERLRARDFLRGGGVFRRLDLSQRSRARLMRGIFRYQAQELPIQSFAVAIDKAAADARGWEPSQAAWTFLFQRLQRFAEAKGDRAMVLMEPELVHRARPLVRHMRRHHRVPFFRGDGDRRVEIRRVVEDPLPATDDGYWLQLADWNAHAALRSEHIEPNNPWTRDLWDLLGPIRLQAVNRLRGGPPGIVIYPQDP